MDSMKKFMAEVLHIGTLLPTRALVHESSSRFDQVPVDLAWFASARHEFQVLPNQPGTSCQVGPSGLNWNLKPGGDMKLSWSIGCPMMLA